MRRRALLSIVGTSALGATAGCTGVFGHGLEGVHLARFAAENLSSDPHEFDLRVRREGETLHQSSHRIPGTDGHRIHSVVAECTWGQTPGLYEVAVRVDGGDWKTKPVTDVRATHGASVGCATALAAYHENDSIWLRLQPNCQEITPSASTGVCPPDRTTNK